jgi:hypothetical protein
MSCVMKVFGLYAVMIGVLCCGWGSGLKTAQAAVISIEEAQSVVPRADEGMGPTWTAGAFMVAGKPDALGTEIALGMQLKPLAGRSLYVGPRVSGIYAAAEKGATRWDLNVGVGETLWLVNAIGSGVDLDAVVVSQLTGQDIPVHFRVTPHLSVRTLAFGREGAWSIRLGVPYDTHYKWGVQAGLVLQLNGVYRSGY